MIGRYCITTVTQLCYNEIDVRPYQIEHVVLSIKHKTDHME